MSFWPRKHKTRSDRQLDSVLQRRISILETLEAEPDCGSMVPQS